jgi:hypothetical protein
VNTLVEQLQDYIIPTSRGNIRDIDAANGSSIENHFNVVDFGPPHNRSRQTRRIEAIVFASTRRGGQRRIDDGTSAALSDYRYQEGGNVLALKKERSRK